MTEVFDHDEHIAELLRQLPPAPAGWIAAAQELPAARVALETLVSRAAADAEQRERIVAALEDALTAEGVEPSAIVVEELRRRLDA